MNSVSNGNAMI